MYDYVFNEEEEMKKERRKQEEKKHFHFFLSLSEKWILEFTCYLWPSIKIKSTINFTLMERISAFSTFVPNQQINCYFTLTFYNKVIKSHQYYTVLSMPYF